MAAHPGPSIAVVAASDPLTSAFVAVLASTQASPRVQTFATLERALAEMPAPDLLVFDEAAALPGDAATLRGLKRAKRDLRVMVLMEDGLGPARGMLASGAVALLKPIVLEELLQIVARLAAPAGAAGASTNSTGAPSAAAIAPAAVDGAANMGWARGLADELATPLATVLGHLQLLAADRRGEADAPRVESIREGMDKLRGTVERLRGASGSRRARPHRGDLTALSLERAASARTVGRIAVKKGPAVAALIDEPLATQILDAMLDFALRATTGSVELTTAVEGPDAVVRVEAAGTSLSAAAAARMFEPYGIEEPASGLVLAEARGLARAHGGEASAQIREGGRLAMMVRLPAAPAS